VLAAAIVARPPPAPPWPVGRPRLERPASSFMKEKPMVCVQLLHLRLPTHQAHVSLRLHYSGRAAAEAGKQLNGTNCSRYGGVNGKRICTEYGRAVWEGWEVRDSALAQQHFSCRFAIKGESNIRYWEK